VRTVGVEYESMVLVVGFTVTTDDIVEIESISEYIPYSNKVLPLNPDFIARYIDSPKFHFATLWAIADFNGQDFDPQTFRRMN